MAGYVWVCRDPLFSPSVLPGDMVYLLRRSKNFRLRRTEKSFESPSPHFNGIEFVRVACATVRFPVTISIQDLVRIENGVSAANQYVRITSPQARCDPVKFPCYIMSLSEPRLFEWSPNLNVCSYWTRYRCQERSILPSTHQAKLSVLRQQPSSSARTMLEWSSTLRRR